MTSAHDKRLFWGCFAALIATAFGFIIRAMIMTEWAKQFGLTETQQGEIFGVGLWPFAISIVLFSLIIDKIGYGRAMVFAFVCHAASAIITICAPLVLVHTGTESEIAAGRTAGYWMLYIGNLIVALGNGTVEAVINPVVATMFPREKTKWLNILHAGWPGGLVLGGILTILLGVVPADMISGVATLSFGDYTLNMWQVKVALIFIPVIIYAVLLVGSRFPVSERVAAGVPYKDMLKEAGILSAMVVVALMVREVGRVFEFSLIVQIIVFAVIVGSYGIYVRSIGRAMFFLLVLIMIPLAITELGTDSWITNLMEPEMTSLGLNAGWVLVYTSFIMMVLRFFAGPIVHRLSPLGLLAVSAAVAAIGLVSLSMSAGALILLAATIYGFGKTFFWPTMLGVVAEQFPKGGALTLNLIAGVGMLGVGVLGNPLLGYFQDTDINQQLEEKHPKILAKAQADETKLSIFGKYKPVEPELVKKLPETDQKIVDNVKKSAQKNTLFKVAIFPVFMLICYLGLIIYFRMRGGYKAEVLAGHEAKDEKFTGGVEGPVEG